MLAIVFHAALLAGVAVSTMYSHSGDMDSGWGMAGGSMTVGLVGSVPAIPLPQPDVVTESRVVDESKGLYKTEPVPPPKVEEKATPIPKFEKNKPPKYNSKPSRLLENKTPPPPNAVPYGGGGSPAVPYSSPAPTMKLGAASEGGMAFNGCGRREFRLALFVVRRGCEPAYLVELAAGHDRSGNSVRAATRRDVSSFARWHGDEHSGDALERQSIGGYVSRPSDTRVEPASGFAGRLQRILRHRRFLV